MSMKFVCVLVLLLVPLACASSFVGGWSPIKNIDDPYVKEIAEFAVTEHNQRSGEHLKLERIIKGEEQLVSGTNFRLTLAATDGSTSHNYEAIVYNKPWAYIRNLISFIPVNP